MNKAPKEKTGITPVYQALSLSFCFAEILEATILSPLLRRERGKRIAHWLWDADEKPIECSTWCVYFYQLGRLGNLMSNRWEENLAPKIWLLFLIFVCLSISPSTVGLLG